MAIAAKKKKVTADSIEHKGAACAALAAAFSDLKDIRPVNIERGTRVGFTLSTGSLMLGLALGGGFQRGRMVDIFGPEGSGKSTILQSIIASAQQAGIPITHYDPETSADPTYMQAQGINLRYTIEHAGKVFPGYYYTQPSTGEEIYRHLLYTMNRMPVLAPDAQCGPTALFIIDSIAAMVTEALDADKGTGAGMGLDARMHSTYLKQLRGRLAKTGSLLVVSNQIRNKIGVMYGDPIVEPGGEAIKFFPDYKIRISRRKMEEDRTGYRVQPFVARTIKNKTFPPFQEATGAIVLGRGIDKAVDASEFLSAIGKLEVKQGKRKILLKQFNTGVLDWKQFRAVTEQPEFRDACFELLKQDKVYDAYFAHLGYLNFSAAAEGETADAVAKQAEQEEVISEEAEELANEQYDEPEVDDVEEVTAE
jgi:recombination protein RecA